MLVQVPEVGQLDFPDDAKPDEILSFLNEKYPKSAAPAPPAETLSEWKPGVADRLKMGLGELAQTTPYRTAAQIPGLIKKETGELGEFTKALFGRNEQRPLPPSPLAGTRFAPENVPSGAELSRDTGLPSAVTETASAVDKIVAGLAQFITSPQGAVQMATYGVPVLKLPMAAKWISDMVKGGYLNIKDAVDAFQKGDTQRLRDNIIGATANFVGALGVGGGEIKSLKDYFNRLDSPQTVTPPASREAPAPMTARDATVPPVNLSPVLAGAGLPPVQGPPARGDVLPMPQGAQPPLLNPEQRARVAAKLKAAWAERETPAPKIPLSPEAAAKGETSIESPLPSQVSPELSAALLADGFKPEVANWTDEDFAKAGWPAAFKLRVKKIIAQHQGEPNAQTIRGNTGQLPPPGQVPPASQETGGHDVERPAPVQPQPLDPRETKAGQVPLTPLDQIKKISAMSGPDFVQHIRDQNNPQALTQNAYDLGLSLTTPEELAALKKAQADNQAALNAADKAGDKELANNLAWKGHLFGEAIGAATGTGSAGRYLQQADPNYKARFPDEPTVPAMLTGEPIQQTAEGAWYQDKATGIKFLETDLDPKTLSLSPDVPNFKRGASTETGEVPGQELQGAYTRINTGRAMVYERLNGTREVITGRHRWQLALRTNADLPVQLVREADGFTKEQALVMDAEANIKDNQGDVFDYAHYFRETKEAYTEETARRRGLLRLAPGRHGWALGKNAGPDLYALWRDNKIATEKAVAIARAAPGNADLQALGIKQAFKGGSPSEIENFIKAVQSQTGGGASEQVDLFGSLEAGEKFQSSPTGSSEVLGNFSKLKDARALAQKTGGSVKGYLNGKYKRGWVVSKFVEPPEVAAPASPSPGGEGRGEGGQPPAAPGELLPAAEQPFNLVGEKTKFVEPKTEQTAFGGETLTQNELFAIQDVVQSKDPQKSADVMQKRFGAAQAVKILENQLAVMAKDPKSYKGYTKPQRAMLQNVMALLRQRAENEMPPGPGALTAKPSSRPDVPEAFEGTALKNAVGELERAGLGLPDATPTQQRKMATAWINSGETLSQNPEAARQLADLLKWNPDMGLTDDQSALVLRHKVALGNSLNDAAERTNRAASPEDRAVAQAEYAQLSNEFTELLDAIKQRGSEWGREGRWRQAIAFEDYSFATQERLLRAAKGGQPLTDAERTDLLSKVEQYKKLAADAQAELTRLKEQKTATGIDEIITDARKEVAGSKRAGVKRDIGAERNRLVKGIKERLDEGEDIADLGSWIQKLARNFVAQGIVTRDPLLDAVHEVVSELVPDFSRRDTMDAISGYGDFKQLSKDEISVKLRDLNGQMQQVAKLDDIMAKQPPLKTGLERRAPSDEERRLIKLVNEAKRRFGIVITDPATQLRSALDARKTYYRNQIADLEAQIARREKFIKTRTPSPTDAELEKLKARRDEVKKEFDTIFQKPGLTDAERLGLMEKSVDRQIAELERQFKTGEIFPAGKKPSTLTSPALRSKRAALDALKEQRKYLRESLQPGPEFDPLATLKKRLDSRIKEYERRMADGDFSRRAAKPVPALDEAATQKSARLARLKKSFADARRIAEASQRNFGERVRDWVSRLRREFLLSSLTSIAKLSAAAMEGIVFESVKELPARAVAAIFPKFAERLETQMPASFRMVGKSLAAAFMKSARDSAQTFKTGSPDFEMAYGDRKSVPPEMQVFMGRIHAMLKTPLKRFGFEKTYAKIAARYHAQGLDVTDPLVQTRIGTLALKEANRYLFLEDNRVTDAYQRFMSRFYQADKLTGKPTPADIAAGTAMRVALPIVKIPTNLVARTFQAAFGLEVGGLRLARAYAKGIESLPGEQADAIMRQIKQGSLGTALLLVGYFNPDVVGGYYQPREKRRPGEPGPGEILVYGHAIPTYWLHHPLLEVVQLGATIRRVSDSKLRKRDLQTQGITNGMKAGLFGLLDETPMAREIFDLDKLHEPGGPGQYINAYAASLTTPQLVSWLAQRFDIDPRTGKPVKRAPQNLTQAVEMGIPGLRQNVPLKKKTAP
jgi:hypothetical protein